MNIPRPSCRFKKYFLLIQIKPLISCILRETYRVNIINISVVEVGYQARIQEEKPKAKYIRLFKYPSAQESCKVKSGHLVFPIGPKNTNLVKDAEILLPVKFRSILFSGFRGEFEKVSANQRPGWPSWFSDRPEKKTQTW